MTRFRLLGLGVLLFFAALGRAQVVLDDFNRANGASPGTNWTVQSGSFQIQSNRAIGSSGSLMTWNNQSSSSITFDIFHNSGGVQYGALVLGYANTSNNLFVKVQANGSSTNFDNVFFYYGNNGSSFGTGTTNFTTTPFASGRVTLTLMGSVATLGIDTNFDGIIDQTFTRNDVPLANLGTGIGVGIFGNSAIDNFALAMPIPEPSTVALFSIGLTIAGAAARRRAKCGK